MSDTRRFYHTPDISLSRVDTQYVLNIAIGSGYQAHPLNTTIEDNFYLVRYPIRYAGEGKYGIPQETSFGTDAPPETIYEPITEDHLYNATQNLIGEGTPDEREAALQQLATTTGWFIEMEGSGEKVLGSSVTFNNKVLFTSYTPGDATDPCSPNVGSGTFWAVNLLDGTPVEQFDTDDELLNKKDRHKNIPSPGLPPAPQTLFLITKDSTSSDDLQVITTSGGNTMLSHDIDSLIDRVYWSEYPNF